MSLTSKEEEFFKNIGDCSGWDMKYSMQNKLLYVLVKEIHESRREARKTNELLHDIKESLLATQRKVEKLAKVVETPNGDFYHLRTKDVR